MSALRKLPHIRQQLELPKASASIRVRAFATVWLRRYWPWLVVFAVVILGGALRGSAGGGR